jgi:hypothetical protein
MFCVEDSEHLVSFDRDYDRRRNCSGRRNANLLPSQASFAESLLAYHPLACGSHPGATEQGNAGGSRPYGENTERLRIS